MTAHAVNQRAVIVSSSRNNVITHLSPELFEAFTALCKKRKLTRSAVMRELIALAVRQEQRGA